MEKLKNLLSPGKTVDDSILYKSGRGDSPTSQRSSKDKGNKDVTSLPSITTQDYSSTAQQSSSPPEAAEAAPVTRSGDPIIDATSSPTHNDGASVATVSTLRPEYPTSVSAGSNASIKSNIIGKVPTGSSLMQESGGLPDVPATDGKFMNDQALVIDTPAPEPRSTTDHAFPLAGGASTTPVVDNLDEPRQTATARQLDPNIGSDSSVLIAEPQTTGVPNADGNLADENVPVQSRDDISTRHMPGAYPETPALESDKTLGQDISTGAGAGASSAAVIAARKAYEKRDSEPTAAHHNTVTAAEPNPYSSTLDPRVDSAARQAAVRSTAGDTSIIAPTDHKYAETEEGPLGPHDNLHGYKQDSRVKEEDQNRTFALAGAVAAGGGASSATSRAQQEIKHEEGSSGPQGSFGEKLQDAQAKDEHKNRNLALAGATAAVVGAGAYEGANHTEQAAPQHPSLAMANYEFPAVANPPSANPPAANPPVPDATLSSTTGPEEREFPLNNARNQTPTTKATNFSYPTSAKDVTAQNLQSRPVVHQEIPKDVAETGAAGAAGLGAYEAFKNQEHYNTAGSSDLHDDPLASAAHPEALKGYDDQRAVPTHATHHTGQEPDPHHSHDAALVAGGAGATAFAGHEDSKSHGKEVQKTEERHRKSEENPRKSEDKEHKHGFFHRIRHPRKSKEGLDKEKEPGSYSENPRSSSDKSSQDRMSPDKQIDESPVIGTDQSAPGSPRHDMGRNKLHKDPPSGYHTK